MLLRYVFYFVYIPPNVFGTELHGSFIIFDNKCFCIGLKCKYNNIVQAFVFFGYYVIKYVAYNCEKYYFSRDHFSIWLQNKKLLTDLDNNTLYKFNL